MNTGIGREELERDLDRILFAAPIRRLADKTQVFPMERNDSIRTRLTHSHEVSNLARSIGVRLAFNHRDEVFGESADELNVERTVPALLAAVGLAHDLGNPPFGHQGEKSIRAWFSQRTWQDDDFLKFDGNCQTFRLLTRLQFLNDNFGLNLTVATLAALLKYPVFSDSTPHAYKKFGIFRSERDAAQDVWHYTGLQEGVRHPLAYVMEACDDIAYSAIDAEDIVKKGYASFYDLMDHLRSGDCATDEVAISVVDVATAKNREFKQENISSTELNDLSMLMFRVKAIAEMVRTATDTFVAQVESIMANTVDRELELISQSDSGALCAALKAFDYRHGFTNKEVLRTELEGHNYIMNTMDMFLAGIDCSDREARPFERYVYGRISENYRRVYGDTDSCEDKAHLLCDVISGMSEGFLQDVHDELRGLRDGDDS